MSGKVIKVAGPLVVADGLSDANVSDVVRVGPQHLIGEILNMTGDRASIQVYEETTGLGPGAEVVTTGVPLSVELGPGMLEGIYDGIQRPLTEIRELTGHTIARGVSIPALNRSKKWDFVPTVKVGDSVAGGDVIGTVQETSAILHKILVPIGKEGVVKSLKSCIDFANKVGYPIVAKPDNGVGANCTYKLNNEDDIYRFFAERDENVVYIIEEFIKGHVETFDGIADSNKNVLISSSHVMLSSIMDCVNEKQEARFYCQPTKNTDIEDIGKRVVKAFDTRSRFFHFEFFRLSEDKKGLGKKGDLVGLEVNMRAPGAYMPDMINYTYDIDVYSMWADMLVYDKCFVDVDRKYSVGYVSRRDGVKYKNSIDDIKNKYKDKILIDVDVPKVLSEAMGDKVLLARSKKEEDLSDIIDFTTEKI